MRPTCAWCGSNDGCDCQERVDCLAVGTVGHAQCGKKACGCPRFRTCEHGGIESVDRFTPTPDKPRHAEAPTFTVEVDEGTELSLILDGSGLVVGRLLTDPYAIRIVQACNSHDALVSALKLILNLEGDGCHGPDDQGCDGDPNCPTCGHAAIAGIARAALKGIE